MTAKHRKGKNNHKNEDNFFKNEVLESEIRAGGNNYTLLLVLFLIIVIGGVTGAWFCFQQHQTLTYLSDNLLGMQMKVVKLQSSHEEFRQSNNKQHLSENLETRLNALEESYTLAQKQVGMALATAEQLKTSDLPAQVLSLHNEMKTRLAEMQQATVSLEHLSHLQSMLKEKNEEFEGVKLQVVELAALSTKLSRKVEDLTGSLGEAESKLEQKAGQVSMLSTTLDGQAFEVLRLKEQLATYQGQLEASTQVLVAVRKLLQNEQSQHVEQQLSALMDEAQIATQSVEQGAEPTAAEKEASPLEVEQASPHDESVGEETAPAEETEQDDLREEVDTAQIEEKIPEGDEAIEEETNRAEVEASEGEEVVKEEQQKAEEEAETSDGEKVTGKSPVEGDNNKAEEEEASEGEKGLEESLLEKVSKGKEELQDVADEAEASEWEEELENQAVEEEGDEAFDEILLEEE